jgi:RNA polymerase sigma factor (sigma-70 family)
MPELDDHQLLAEFARDNSETAFGALVRRHLNLVFSTARRSLGDDHAAEEVAQAVFIILARKASRLSPKVVLSGWLYQTTRLTAANYLRGEMRRRQREQEAYMQSLLNEPDTHDAWQQIAPLLDEALDKLRPRDRDAIALRFFENKALSEVGRALGSSEDAAKVRVNRALEKLRKIFSKRGVTLTAALIAGAVSANSVQAAPAGLAATFTANAAAGGATISTAITTLVKGTMKTMTWLKIKFAAGAGLAALVVAGAATVAVSQISGGDNSGGDKLTAQEIAKKTEDAYTALSSYSDEGGTASTLGTTAVAPVTFSIRLARTNFYRVGWTQASAFFVSKGVAWSAGDGDFLKILENSPVQKEPNREGALASATGVSVGASATIPGSFFNMNWGGGIGVWMKSGERKPDEKIDGVDCYVLTLTQGGRTETLRIGKQDFLIRQKESISSAAEVKKALNEAARRSPGKFFPTNTPSGDVRSVETHSNIVVNANFSPADFAP